MGGVGDALVTVELSGSSHVVIQHPVLLSETLTEKGLVYLQIQIFFTNIYVM